MYQVLSLSSNIMIGILHLNAFSNHYKALNRQKLLEEGKTFILREQAILPEALQYNAEGKPFLLNSKVGLSISHTSELLCMAFNSLGCIGIDLETPRPALIKVAAKFLTPQEMQSVGQSLSALCGYWCAKEALFKYHGVKGAFLKSHFNVTGLWPHLEGCIVDPFRRAIPLKGFNYKTHMGVCAYEESA